MYDDDGMLPRWLRVALGVVIPVVGISMLVGGAISVATGGSFSTGAGWGAVAGLAVVATALTVLSFGAAAPLYRE